MERKYELTDETINVDDKTLHRIKAVRDFSNVKAGDLGGFIENEDNLSHDGYAWIYDNARVFDKAQVYNDARIYHKACVYGRAQILGKAQVRGIAQVYESACISENAQVYGKACIYGDAWVLDMARVHGMACVYGYDTFINDNARLYDDANISSNKDLCTFNYFGSRSDITTAFKTKDGDIKVSCGCFRGTLEEFREKVKITHGDNQYAKEYLMMSDLIELKLKQ